tara:strand:- start:1958 stop:2251 length:294 start_codon:yes stop_codon:yes gene_type:complete
MGSTLEAQKKKAPKRKTLEYRYSINPKTGLPYTKEERGPFVKKPKPGGIGYTIKDNTGFGTETLEFVPSRDFPEDVDDIKKLLERNDGGMASKTRVF